MTAIHQFVGGFNRSDAISNEALVMRDLFRSWGHTSDIFSETRRILPEYRKDVHEAQTYRSVCSEEDIVLLHLSTGSPVNEVFAGLPCRKALLYHNITPPAFFSGIQEETARHLERGREQAARLAGVADLNLAHSAFSKSDLESMGYTDVKVLPLLLDLTRLRRPPCPKTLAKYNDDLVNILFVGRCAPNKRIEDVVHAFYYFQKYVEPNSRLIHVGSSAGMERYHALLLTLVTDLEVRNVELLGPVTQEQLMAYYALADVFLCMSEHEGFCIPLLESMMHDVPLLAYDAGAVAETMDGAGILFADKQFDTIAEMMGRVVTDEGFRSAVLQGQRERVERYQAQDLEKMLRECLGAWL